ncbi:protein still life, isoform SIF type 1 isoform X4 [Parasteatoda tepidariorum]|uniref:protein still life, isoform SIF type 1 isoform X4 n=1 Tax=Parasteatoda tepidariorum TaxID=114398 RepID=UPI001C71B96E|nr:protein still life, isoform SIF type 1 isoform X1 [Parasteatoda tepidariorum]XP_042906310.1 protein still life, isoform SIF type 1 isoform X1 [Parasteatoda tepidariorum]
MGNKLSCSCAPLIRKAYRYEDSPWNNSRRRDGHLLRSEQRWLWAEVFHVSSSTGAARWQQVSEDLVPVNITCVQDSPECIFHITAYNSQVEKILDVRLVQPGTRLGQASECFVYWKDPTSGDTWGLNFTSPVDAKQFRDCCQLKIKPGKRVPQSTPSSPSKSGREPRCTCAMTIEQMQRARNGRARYAASVAAGSLPTSASTLPRSQSRPGEGAYGKLSAHPSSQSVYDNVSTSLRRSTPLPNAVKQTRSDVNLSTIGQRETVTLSRTELARAKFAQSSRGSEDAKSVDYGMGMGAIMRSSQEIREGNKSKSIDNVSGKTTPTASRAANSGSLDSTTAKKALTSSLHNSPDDKLKPTPPPKPGKPEPPPKTGQRGKSSRGASSGGGGSSSKPSTKDTKTGASSSKGTASKSSKAGSSKKKPSGKKMGLEIPDRERSPPSDNLLYDNLCYATTPSSSNQDSDVPFLSSEDEERHARSDVKQAEKKRKEGRGIMSNRKSLNNPTNSPTSKLLMEYEMHLRNALARGLDAESYSLHTFEALLTQSMENVVALMREVHTELEEVRKEEQALQTFDEPEGSRAFANARSTTTGPKASALPLPGSTRQPPHLAARGESTPLLPRASMESTDSRIYLTSSEMSDDDRLSLTTAVSDEEDPADPRTSSAGHQQQHPSSSYGGSYGNRSRSGAAAASFNCTGAVRKAGFLSVKKWLLRKRQQVELARKRGWKGYWVCLKGTTLLFYPCDNRDGRAIDTTPKHLIIVDGAIMQPIPEHPKRDFIFCLSTAFGDAYLFQAPCQVELETWINSIHSACAAAFARHRGKTGTLHLLQEEIFRLEKEIESDSRMKHMAELQLTVVADSDSRQSLTGQIGQWEENLERLHCEQFRLRCYMSSLQNSELPNPKSLLTHVSKGTKSILNKLGVFTVSSFHAFICARSPSLLTNLLSGRGATKRRPRLPLSRSNSSKRSLSLSANSSQSTELPTLIGRTVKVLLPEGQSVTVCVRDNMTVEDVLWSACLKKQLAPSDHFLHIKQDNDKYYTPAPTELFDQLAYETVEICAKVLYQVELLRCSLEVLFGFGVEAELIENADHQDELCVYVSRVEENSQAWEQGLMKGDEIMVINGAIVSDLDMMYIESVLQEELSLCMMMRSARLEPPDMTGVILRTTDDYIESLVCPPPPSDSAISEEMIDKLIVPSPLYGDMDKEKSPETSGRPTPSPTPMPSQDLLAGQLSAEQIETLIKTAEQVTEYCRMPIEQRRLSSLAGSTASSGSSSFTITTVTPSRQLTEAEKLRKVIMELLETEKTYVKHMSEVIEWYEDATQKNLCFLCDGRLHHTEHLNSLLEHYLEPMKKETFLSNSEVNALFGNIQEIVQFQRVFLQSLEEAIASEVDFHRFDHPAQFKNVLFALGNSFLYYADQFKLYSSFCASHSKAQKVLHPSKCKGLRNKDHVCPAAGEGNSALLEFLQSRNPKGQHSFSLESYLIKPIQRILKYPLLLQQLKHLTDPNSQEHLHLSEALKGMERVAEHINEMQRIHEEYGAIFDHLSRQHYKSSRQHVDLSPGELLYYGGVEWLNISEFLGKIKKGLELHAMCFVFKAAVVFLCKERIRQKKKLMGGSSKTGATEVEIIRYQVLIPVTEVQVRAGCVKEGDSHFLWELIHLRSQMQRRSEKIYQLSNSTSEFRNAFLRTIRQTIRESVRNMTVPVNKPVSKDKSGERSSGRRSGPESGSATMARTLSGKKRPKSVQRHSAGAMEQEVTVETYDNLEQNFHTRSKTVTDGMDDMDASERSDRSDRSDKSDHLHRLPGKTSNSLGKGGLVYIQAAHDKGGSPVWKLRGENDKSATLPHPPKGQQQYYDGSAPLYKKDHCTSSGLSKPPLEC